MRSIACRSLVAVVALSLAACGGPSAGSPDRGEKESRDETAAVLPGAVAAAVPVGGCFDRGPGDYIDAIERAEGSRSFRIHVPASYEGRGLSPLLFNFHGQGRTAEEQEAYSGLVPVSEAGGFILVTPEGSDRQWDIIGVYADEGNDDIGAVSEILDYLKGQFCVDPSRVFATGLSNGAQMAAQAGCLLPYHFAGVAPVAGIVYQGCEGPPVAVIAFHGTEDYNVPYDSAPEAVVEWARYNGCLERPDTQRVGAQAVRDDYFGCSGQPVVFYTLEGGGHTWPGAEDNTGGAGPTNHEIHASELIWEFFRNVRRTD